MSSSATARLEARLPRHIHALLKRAADLQGRTLTDFVVASAREAAERAIEKHHIIQLSLEDQMRFAQALIDPPEPAPRLREAIELHRRNVEMR